MKVGDQLYALENGLHMAFIFAEIFGIGFHSLPVFHHSHKLCRGVLKVNMQMAFLVLAWGEI
jgi:hypothetical protein